MARSEKAGGRGRRKEPPGGGGKGGGPAPPAGARTTRRAFLGQAAAALAAPALAARAPGRALPVRGVVLVVADTFRADALDLGGGWTRTPNLARLAREGQLFTNAFAASFPTVPHRRDLFTGTFGFPGRDWSALEPGLPTLAEAAAAAGVRPVLVADTPHPYTKEMNYQRGFETVERIRGQENDPWRREPAVVVLPCAPEKLRQPWTHLAQHLRNTAGRRGEAECFVARTVAAACRRLEALRPGGPFLLVVDAFDPHEPWDPPREYVRLYEPDGYAGEEVPFPRYGPWREFLAEEELRHCRALYAAEATLVDRWLGRLLERLEELDLAGETAVLFTSDHGFYLGEHGYIGKSVMPHEANVYLPLWPEACRIPLVARVPGAPAGLCQGALVQPPDLMPTVLELLGAPVPGTVQGRSLVPLLVGGEAGLRPAAFSSPAVWDPRWEVPRIDVRTTVTDGEYLLVFGPGVERMLAEAPGLPGSPSPELVAAWRETVADRGPELYHLPTDPACARNAAGDLPDVVEGLRRELAAFLQVRGVPPAWLRLYRPR